MTNRSNNWFPVYAVIENRGDKLALFGGEVPIFWLRKVAQARANKFNSGGDYVHIERVMIHRLDRRGRTIRKRKP